MKETSYAGLVEPTIDLELPTEEASKLQRALDRIVNVHPSDQNNKFTVGFNVDHARGALHIIVNGRSGPHEVDALEIVPSLRNVMQGTSWRLQDLFGKAARISDGGNTYNFLASTAVVNRATSQLTDTTVPPVLYIGPADQELRQKVLDTHGSAAAYSAQPHLRRRVSMHMPYLTSGAKTKELMLSAPGSSIDRQRAALRDGIRTLPAGSTVVTPADLLDDDDTHVHQSIIPSSWAPLRRDMLARHRMLINTGELSRIAPEVDAAAFEEAFARVLQGDADATQVIDAVLREYCSPHLDRIAASDHRVAAIGTGGGSLTIYRLAGHRAFHVIANGFMEQEREAVELLDAPGIVAWNMHNLTGRGDAMAAGSSVDAHAHDILRSVAGMKSETREERKRLNLGSKLLPPLCGLSLGAFVYHANSANLGEVPPEAMARVLGTLALQTASVAQQMDPQLRTMQTAKTSWGVPLAAWTCKA
jgi:hypothetical protein